MHGPPGGLHDLAVKHSAAAVPLRRCPPACDPEKPARPARAYLTAERSHSAEKMAAVTAPEAEVLPRPSLPAPGPSPTPFPAPARCCWIVIPARSCAERSRPRGAQVSRGGPLESRKAGVAPVTVPPPLPRPQPWGASVSGCSRCTAVSRFAELWAA